MATKMRTGRMTVKTTTKPNTGIKPKVTTTPETTVTGKRKEFAPPTDVEGQWKYYGKDPRHEYEPGLGKKTKHQKLTGEELKKFRERERGMGIKLLAKEVRYDPTDKARRKMDGLPSRYQTDYYNPNTEKAAYEAESRRRYAEEGSPVMKTRELPKSNTSLKLMQPQKRTEMVNKAIQGPGIKGRSFKKKASVTNRLKGGSINTGAEGRKFRKEEKLAGAYERTKKYADQNTPEDVRKGPNVAAGAFSKEKKAGYKSLRKDIKSEIKGASKLNVSTEAKAGYKKELKGALKDTRKSQKFEKKEQVGKTKYFTKSKLAETVKKTPSMKPVTQAGKTRYKK